MALHVFKREVVRFEQTLGLAMCSLGQVNLARCKLRGYVEDDLGVVEGYPKNQFLTGTSSSAEAT